MILTVNATDFWGRETVQTLNIRSSQEAERALAELYRCLPQALRQTYQAVVFAATGMRSTKVSDRQMFGVEVATEKSNEDCGQGAW